VGRIRSSPPSPSPAHWRLDPLAGYCHITSNETANGLQLQEFPALPVPLVVDMTSDFLTRPVPVERFGVIYASTQKNLGAAGLCVVIVRDDLLQAPPAGLPAAFSYAVQAEQQSRFNTPPTFTLYVAALMLRWIKQRGGAEAMATAARQKSALLYRYIDGSDLYHCPQKVQDRSSINVCFQLADAGLTEIFLDQAEQCGLTHLRGHAAFGGVRASLYNAMPVSGVQQLVGFMADFEQRHG